MNQEQEEGDPSSRNRPLPGKTYIVKWVNRSGEQQRSQVMKDKLVAAAWVEFLSEMFRGQPAWLEEATLISKATSAADPTI